MTDFLLELRSEEIPARMQDDARQNLKRLFEGELAKAGLKADDIATYATPRRLALIAHGLPLETQAVSEEIKGPKTTAPPQALEGFLRKTGLTQDQLVERDGVYFAVINKPGRATADVLAEAIPAIIRAFPWPKSMRWGDASASTESLRWVRPLQGIVALLGDDVVPCEVDGIVSGSATMGHRFHHSGPVTIGNAGDYETKLRACHVIVDQNERENIIREGALKAAADAGLVLVQDPGLVAENAGLTEWPVPMLGRFDPAFLSVPEEVIQLTARVNQKYFVCQDAGGKLANAFVCTANIVAKDGGAAIVAGNEKVLAARLSDAKFFWEQDLKVRLEDQATKLSSIVFHEKLGTVADKVERVAKLARWLVESGVVNPSPLAGEGQRRAASQGEGASAPNSGALTPSPSLAAQAFPSPARGEGFSLADAAERAARLCKADLVTGMVGEFPELQGIMGGYYARAQGEDDAVADAIRDHYKPVGQGDDVPTAPVTVAVSLADKLDTLSCFFAFDMQPTGSKDPFALRRAAIGILRLLLANQVRLKLGSLLTQEYMMSILAHSIRQVEEDVRRDLQALDPLPETHTTENAMAIVQARREELLSVERLEQFLRSASDIVPFLIDRLKVQQREAGVRHDLIDAVFALGGEDDLVRLLARVKALQAFVGTEDGVNLLAGYKRATRVIPAQAGIHEHAVSESGADSSTEVRMGSRLRGNDEVGVETALRTALDTAEPLAAAAIEAEDFASAMTALASLRAPIDAFFEGVMVNDPDPDKRAYRLGLLTRFRDAVHRVADFSKIEG
jgi:glycyl-tRNA synthetase beta chain